jgi:excisionase family DNA binding protein
MPAEPLPLFAIDDLASSGSAPARRSRTAPRPTDNRASDPGERSGRREQHEGLPRQPMTQAPPPLPRLLLTTGEAARCLGIGRSKLYQLLSSGVIESCLIGAARRVPADALTAYVDSLRQAHARALPQTAVHNLENPAVSVGKAPDDRPAGLAQQVRRTR